MATLDDGRQSLSEIARARGKSIVSLLADIAGTPGAIQPRLLRFLRNLECLRLPDCPGGHGSTRVDRHQIDALQPGHDYVALSYTWVASAHESTTAGLYSVQTRDGTRWEPSEVRNLVLDRIFNYMRAAGVDLLWIDQHSIVQGDPDCTDPDPACGDDDCIENRKAMQVMDLVYKRSSHPVGLLGRPITSAYELRLLANILQGELTSVRGDQIRLSHHKSSKHTWHALELLSRITADKWWQSGWVFQENYKAGTRMALLIRHVEHLEPVKQRHPVFGTLRGELCIRSVDFMEGATRLCLACRHQIARYRGPSSAWATRKAKTIDRILAAAGRYQLTVPPSDPMTPRIVHDIERRTMRERWNRLAITANCCQYSQRLDIQHLQRSATASLSLSMLALCLLNGEVLHNGHPAIAAATDMTATQYLASRLFRDFQTPGGASHSLTFNKSCRFIDPALAERGIATSGHLWRLHKTVDTRHWRPEGTWVDGLAGTLEPLQRRSLACLVEHLARHGHVALADEIDALLHRDARTRAGGLLFSERYMLAMAAEVADAIARGGILRLACLWGERGAATTTPYMAVFVWDDGTGGDGGGGTWEGGEPSLAFTASRPEDGGSGVWKSRDDCEGGDDECDASDLDRHVSFEVEVGKEGAVVAAAGGRVVAPGLRIRRWLPGVCFFRGVERWPVVFPWPRDLEAIGR
ncbi:hypothetical protein B0T24DRAFT_627072 [Lasiosphaeria ovina]|uniref:Heterokaryon incompatibility domain-containing protein n=1 Tax=Lasiosphaeria ovina TaxID=92902 RepID=A0AAE0K6J8_9PEZI|nr:hypothetical protein B0T24DRAFT_627072 [Lasiosphaeria ovina]